MVRYACTDMTASTNTNRSPDARNNILGAVLLLLLVLAAYGPALHAGFIWDDDMFITDNETLQSADGLRVIWTEPAKNPHFYPLLMTLFRVMYQLWGANPAGYHLVTVLFHAGAALLFWRLLLAVGARGAFLAAMVFALHPVHVQSVAWATELKNTMSGVFYLAALLAWAREDRLGRARAYGLCALSFAAALLSKTTTISLPLALLLLELWRHGRIRRATIGLVLGLVALALVPALVTLGLERSRNVSDVATQFLFPEKLIVVGLSVWFYLGKLLWPHPLIMVYPYWQLDWSQWREYVPLAALVASVPALFFARRRLGVGPLLAWVFFIATLVPIPFMDVNFVLQHSFVADHFLYLPSLGVIAVLVSALSTVGDRLAPAARFGLAGLVAVGLGGMTWNQCRHYDDQEALWRHTLNYNPACAVAYNNLGLTLLQKGRVDEAIDVFRRGIEREPRMAKFHSDLAVAYMRKADSAAAASEFEKAIEIDPAFYDARLELASLHVRRGDVSAALGAMNGAVGARPGAWEARWNLGILLLADGRMAEAPAAFEKALALRAGDAALASAFRLLVGREQGWEILQDAVRASPTIVLRDKAALQPRLLLAQALAGSGDTTAAEALLGEVARQQQKSAEVLYQLGAIALAKGEFGGAADYFARALAVDPASYELMNNLAWVRATAPVEGVRDGMAAVALAERAVAVTKRIDPALLDTLAASYAEAGRFEDAVAVANEGLEKARNSGLDSLARDMESHLDGYRSGMPCRDVR